MSVPPILAAKSRVSITEVERNGGDDGQERSCESAADGRLRERVGRTGLRDVPADIGKRG